MVLRDGDRELRAEVTTAFYDPLHAQFLWMPARGRQDTPRTWAGVLFDEHLLENINRRLEEKCEGDYGPVCVLLLSVHPTVTTTMMICEVLENVVLPTRNPFQGIYLVGHFTKSRIGMAELEVRQLA